MIKAWLLIFIMEPNDDYLGKVEVPLTSMAECRNAQRRLQFEDHTVRYRILCVTDDHHSGRSVDPGVPLDF